MSALTTRPRDRAVTGLREAVHSRRRSPSVLVIGAGAGGLCTGAQLKRAGVESFTIVDAAPHVGGTWRDNTYPGAACDVPSHLYSFSFAPEPGWTRKFAPQPEIRRYFESLVDRFDLGPHLRLGSAVTALRWDEGSLCWRATLADGTELTADVVVSGTGQLNRPHYPEIEGIEHFEGTAFHSARWDHDHDLTGRRVGVIGNAASAIQFVPEIAPKVERLVIFQRSANWVIPKPDRPYRGWERQLYRRVPALLAASRARIFLRLDLNFGLMKQGSWQGKLVARTVTRGLSKIESDKLPREALVPDYPPGCKRLLISNDWYPTLLRRNVDLELSPISHATAAGLETEDGTHHDLDTIIYATGFDTKGFLMPMEVRGEEGTELHDAWGGVPRAHLGLCVPGFPNLFMLYGPNTNLGHNSILYMIEGQVDYLLQCLTELVETDTAALAVHPDAMAASNRRLDEELGSTVWAGGCGSWYKTADGVITNNWSESARNYRRRVATPDFAEYRRIRLGAGQGATQGAVSVNTMMLPE